MELERASFIVRLWLEPSLREGGRWRGHIQHVQTGEAVYFHDLREMLRFIEEHSGVPFPLQDSSRAHQGG